MTPFYNSERRRSPDRQIGDTDMLQKQKGYVMGICIDGVHCTFKGVLKMAEEERKTSEPSEQPG
jgi:hypothetical protein